MQSLKRIWAAPAASAAISCAAPANAGQWWHGAVRQRRAVLAARGAGRRSSNFTAKPQRVSFDLTAQGITGRTVRTLLKTRGSNDAASLTGIKVQPFGVYLLQAR